MIRRSPIARRSPKVKPAVKKRRAAKRAKRAELLVLDCAWRDRVFERDEFRCLRCGTSKGIQGAHVITRADKKLRHLDENGLTLCGGCHIFWWHKEPLDAVSWFQTRYPERYELLMEARRK